MKPLKFKEFLLIEQKDYLAHKVANILTSVHEIVEAGKQLGTKQLVKQTEVIVNQMRKVLHTSWPRSEHKYLKVIQKCGVALMKAIEEKGDLPEVYNSVKVELEKLSGKLGEPVSNLAGAAEETPKKQEPPPPPGSEPVGPTEQLPPQNMSQLTTGQ